MTDPAMTHREIYERIEEELRLVMGPLASVIMKEKTAEFGLEKEDFPEGRLAELVEEASFEIQNNRRKVQFQRAALAILREVPQQPAVPEKKAVVKEDRMGEVRPTRRLKLRLADDGATKGEA
jgi:hypothetical protein